MNVYLLLNTPNSAQRLGVAARLLLSIALCVSVISCGGSGAQMDRAGQSLKVRVSSNQTREIPSAAKSIKVTAAVLQPDTGEIVSTAVAQRQTGQTSVELNLQKVPSVKVRLTATAHASTDGSGPALAAGSTVVDVAPEQTASVNITLQATAGSIRVDPQSLSIWTTETNALVAAFLNPNGQSVDIDPARWVFTSDDPSKATVAKRQGADGFIADVTGVAQGSTTIRVADAETGLTSLVPVTVGPDRCPFFKMTAPGDTNTTRDFSGTGVSYEFGGGAIGGDNVLSITAFGATVTAESVLYYTVDAELTPDTAYPIKAVWEGLATIEQGSVSITLTVNGETRTFASGTSENDVPIRLEVPLTVRHGDLLKVEFAASGTSSSETANVNPRGSMRWEGTNGFYINIEDCDHG